MLTAFASQDGKVRRVTEPLRDAVWIDVLSATPDELELVSRETGLEIPTEAAIDEIESSSRLRTHKNVLYLSMPLVRQPETNPSTISIGFVLTPDRLITVRFAPSRVFDHFIEELCGGQVEANS